MHSTVKNLATFCIISAVIHVFMGIAFIIYATGFKLAFAVSFTMTVYIIAGFVASLIMSCSLRSLCSNLELEYESTIRSQNQLKKRIEALEFKVNM